jgi:hypothetical protein
MPNWNLHNDWATKLGIERKVSNWVNKREDKPRIDVSSTMDKRLQANLMTFPDTPPTYDEITNLGDAYLKAWMLHLVLDEIEDTYEYLVSKARRHKNDNIRDDIIAIVLDSPFYRLVPNDIHTFVTEHLDTILQDIREANPKIGLYAHFLSTVPPR